MKKILIFIFVFATLLALPLSAFATSDATAEEETPIPETETPAEGEISGESTVPGTSAQSQPITDRVVAFITENYTGSTLIAFTITAIVNVVYAVRKNKGLTGAIGVLNNNAVTVSEKSEAAVASAREQIRLAADTIEGYKSEVKELLSEIRKSAEEKATLEELIRNVSTRLECFKQADVELANELAQLLNLSNLPNSVKEELYARHKAALALIEGTDEGKVTTNDGNEA